MTEADEEKVVSINQKSRTVVFESNPHERQTTTIWGVADLIIQHAPILKKKRKWVEATIKRLIHAEKHSVYSRVLLYCGDNLSEVDKHFINLKIETHAKLAVASDDEVVTWGDR